MENMTNSNMDQRLQKLNPYQREAVLDESPACMVNANVGSGKTTVLIEKVCYLHEKKKIPYEKMAVLTFTNKAADEIAERLSKQEETLTEDELWGFGTFHSVALRILRKFLPEAEAQAEIKETCVLAETKEATPKGHVTQEENATKNTSWNLEFTVIDPDEEMERILLLAKEHGYKIKYQNRLKKRMEQDYNAYLSGKTKGKYKDDLFLVFPLLDQWKRQENKMSFADLLREGTRVAREHVEELDLQWIIVDEVQDSDEKQLELLEALQGCRTHFFAVGDPNQVIYSWRGTGPNMFFLIKHKFGAKELSLPINYRSTRVILKAANRFLQFGGRIEGNDNTENGVGDKILIKNHYDPFTEAEYLAERIRGLHESGLAYEDIAIFYRVQKQAEILEKVFERTGIPYVFQQKHTDDDELVPEKPHMIREEKSIEESDARNAVEKSQVASAGVHLMTLHASKGLEFDYVFIIGMNQGLIPLRCKSMEQEEEERRLCFVGLTRARRNLELSYYTNPTIPGTLETPSNYLKMLPEELLDWDEKPGSDARKANLQKLRREAQELIREKRQGERREEKQESVAEKEEVDMKVDKEPEKATEQEVRRARHLKYGEGVVVSEDDMMIELEFPGYGKKQFLKAFGEVELLNDK